jgi:hypothetical protein
VTGRLSAATLATALLGVSLASCGDRAERTGRAGGPPKTVKKPAPPRGSDTHDAKAAAAVATQWLESLATGDYRSACATRSQSEQAQFARLAGSCPHAVALIVKKRGGRDGMRRLAMAHPGRVRIRGRIAAIPFVGPGATKPSFLIAARRDAGGWRAADVPDRVLAGLVGPELAYVATAGADALIQQNVRKAVIALENCFVEREDYRKCDSRQNLARHLEIAPERLQVHAAQDSYDIVGRSDTGNTFTWRMRSDGALVRYCKGPEVHGGCRRGHWLLAGKPQPIVHHF